MDQSRDGGRPDRPHGGRANWSPDGTAVSKYMRRVVIPEARGRKAASSAKGIFLLAVGAVFWFALPADPHLGINLHVVGIIIACFGLLGLLWPRRRGLPVHSDWLRRWVIPSGTGRFGSGPPGGYAAGHAATPGDGQQPMIGNFSDEPGRPTLADDLLSIERDPPL
jgi:hypothetical protein